MSDVTKVLGQLAAAATTNEDLYTAPNLSQVTVSTLTVCNRTAGALTYRIAVRPAGEALDAKHYIAYDRSVAINFTDNWSIGITIKESDVITVYASATGLSFNLFGVETT
tara:strand:+ start:2318 stop:2647 length:330 start_codon:yes stop_codon:yes gene_type:complete